MTLADNPVFAREMRQAARLSRTPAILATVTAICGLVVCSTGGVASTSAAPAEVGSVLFQTFFALAFGLVCWVGPGVAAMTIASERTGRTLETLVLTGLSPRTIARGKFAASLAYIGMYVVALAPVGALPFLFGGVTATEVVLAFVVLGVFAVLAVGFGLATSSGARSSSVALLVTLPIAVGVSMFVFSWLGVGTSIAVHQLWPGVSEGAPVWLPSAYVRADFGAEYVIYLLVLPLAATFVLATFFYEVTVANLSDPSDDRSSGIKRWFLRSTAVVGGSALLPLLVVTEGRFAFVALALGGCLFLSLFTLFDLAAEPAGPSRRVRSLWARANASAFVRFLGPGMTRSALLLLGTTLAAEVAVLSAGMGAMRGTLESPRGHAEPVLAFAAYGACFFTFLVGFVTFMRGAKPGRFSPRARLGLMLFFAFAGPFFAVAITGHGGGFFEDASYVAAVSPLYVIAMTFDLERATSTLSTVLPGSVAMSAWGAGGVVLLVLGARRLSVAERSAEAAWKRLDAESASPTVDTSGEATP